MAKTPNSKHPSDEIRMSRQSIGDANTDGILTEQEVFAALEGKHPSKALQDYFMYVLQNETLAYASLMPRDKNGFIAAVAHDDMQMKTDIIVAEMKRVLSPRVLATTRYGR